MSIPAAGSEELVGAAMQALSQWWRKYFRGRHARPEEPGDVQTWPTSPDATGTYSPGAKHKRRAR